MKIRKDGAEIEKKLADARAIIEEILEDYAEDCALYGWDNFTETVANAGAQLYLVQMMIHNAEVGQDRYM